MADKLTQQVLDALSRAAAEPTGLPLYAGKAEPGLFPNAASSKPAAQKCLADDLVRVARVDAKGKSARDLYTLTDKGWEFLLAAVNPKQVLEDFVRVLEARQGEVGELLATARRMSDSLQGLKDAVSRVLPVVELARITPVVSREPASAEASAQPLLREGATSCTSGADAGSGLTTEAHSFEANGAVALLDASDLAPAICSHLASRTEATDCPLPELFRALAGTEPLTIGVFHDCLRELHADGVLTLNPWTAPLYALPEPQYALLSGHSIAYFASLKSGQWAVVSGQ